MFENKAEKKNIGQKVWIMHKLEQNDVDNLNACWVSV